MRKWYPPSVNNGCSGWDVAEQLLVISNLVELVCPQHLAIC